MLAQDSAQAEIALKRLNDLVGTDHVLTDAADLEFFAMDVYRSHALPLAVIQPGTVEELCAVVKLAAESDLQRWSACAERFDLRMFDGDHFYTQSQQDDVLRALRFDSGADARHLVA